MAKMLTKKVKKEIKSYIEANQPEIEWDYRNAWSDYDIKELFTKGKDEYLWELWEYNVAYIFQIEDSFINEIKSDYPDYDGDEIDQFSREHICVGMNAEGLLGLLPPLAIRVNVYSNYDCCNSFDECEPETYLGEVYERVKEGVRKEDYMWEFYNGAYGGALFCFVAKVDYKDLEKLIELQAGENKKIVIPKGTQFGFHSSFHGCSSLFEKRTTKEMILPMQEAEYDYIAIVIDIMNSYSLSQVFGGDYFIDEQEIKII